MIFDDNLSILYRNLDRYVRQGCYPFCAGMDPLGDVERFLAPDKYYLAKSMKRHDYQCLSSCYDDSVDARRSGLTRRFHNSYLYKEAKKQFGSHAKNYMKSIFSAFRLLGISDGSIPIHPEIWQMGKTTSGYCMQRDQNVLVWYVRGLSPLSTISHYYHEMGHALQIQLGLLCPNYQNIQQQILWQTSRTEDESKQTEKNMQRQVQHEAESHAEVFSATMLLLRARTEREYQLARKFVLNSAVQRMIYHLGHEEAVYNYYRPLQEVLKKTDALGRHGRARFGEKNGVFYPETIAQWTHDVAKRNMLSNEELQEICRFKGKLSEVGTYRGNKSLPWRKEMKEAALWMQQNYEEINTQVFGETLMQAKSRRDIYDTFKIFGKDNPRIARLYHVYTNTNAKGLAYDLLRKKEEVLGVDKLFGIFAEKRRQLGARIVQSFYYGR